MGLPSSASSQGGSTSFASLAERARSAVASTPPGVSPGALSDALRGVLANWQDDTRLYRIEPAGEEGPLPGQLLVESFLRVDKLSEPYWMQVNCLSLDAHLDDRELCAQAVTLITRLADGTEHRVSGHVLAVRSLGGNGGFARYALTVRPWIALPRHTLDCNGWTDKSLIELVEAIFSDHPTIAGWRWDQGVETWVRQGLFARADGRRAYCAQYRESDLQFVSRLLAEEGVGWRLEEDDTSPGRHRVVLFVDSAAQPQDPTSEAALGGAGIRFHRSGSQEAQDGIQAFGAVRRLGSTATTVQGWNPEANRAHAGTAPTKHRWGGEEAVGMQRWLESYDPSACQLLCDEAAHFMAVRIQEAQEARFKTWLGLGTVRTLRPGTWFAITQSTLDPLRAFGQEDKDREFFVTGTVNLGINNLPDQLIDAVASSLGETLHEVLAETGESVQDAQLDGGTVEGHGMPPWHEPIDTRLLIERASQTGHACQFEAIRRDVPWRPVLLDDTGLRLRPRPTALGYQTAIVAGPDGETSPRGADEIHTDGRGRIKVRFTWQDEQVMARKDGGAGGRKRAGRHSCWVRVMQRLAGQGMGHQFIPRIGMEVLVAFINNDVDMPIVVSALPNGRGEGGVPRTPGGASAAWDTSAFTRSSDHMPAGQMNLVNTGSGGNSPAWHGGAPGATGEGQPGQNNAAALSGIKSKEFGGQGSNQLVFDDTPNQQALHLHTTQDQTWLQMGHLLHRADNHRGSFRGLGFELRTDAWGGLRAVRGVMLSSYALRNGLGQTAEGAGDNAAGMALARQMQQLATNFNQAARAHQTVGLAVVEGTVVPDGSMLDDTLAPAAALTKSLSGMVSACTLALGVGDAADKSTDTGVGKVPHMADPNIVLVGKAGVGLTAGLDVHLSAHDSATVASGRGLHMAVGGQARVHSGQAMGVLAGAVQAGSGAAAGKGLTMIAAQGAIDMQAQAGAVQVAAKQALEIKTANGVVNLAAAKKVVLAVSGGASIVIEGGALSVICPGKITVMAGGKAMGGPARAETPPPDLPKSDFCVPCMLRAIQSASPLVPA